MNHYIHTDYKQTVEEYLVVLEVDEGGVGQLPLNIKKNVHGSDMMSSNE